MKQNQEAKHKIQVQKDMEFIVEMQKDLVKDLANEEEKAYDADYLSFESYRLSILQTALDFIKK